MNNTIDFSANADERINDSISNLDSVSNILIAKKGGDSWILRIVLTVIYSFGVIGCIYYMLICKNISSTAIYATFGYYISILTGVSCAIFLLTLVIRNIIESKFYKVIYDGENDIKTLKKQIKDARKKYENCAEIISGDSINYDYEVTFGKNVENCVTSISERIEAIEGIKTEKIGSFLSMLYYIAALLVGSSFALITGTVAMDAVSGIIVACFGASVEDANGLSLFIILLCAVLGVMGGVFGSRYYFEEILLLHMRDSLIFLIVFSGGIGYILSLCGVALVALIIAVIIGLIVGVVYIIGFLVGLVLFIAIIYGIFSGG